jgi:uncharacterized protein (TIGR02147 family)
MQVNIYDQDDYKKILKAEIKANQAIRGYQSLIARAADCQTSFLSQVLNGHTHLTPDQASGIAEFLGLDNHATEYFLLTVHLARASKPNYRSYLNRQLEQIRRNQERISSQLKSEPISSTANEALYYSAWYRCALHVILSIPNYQNVEVIAERLGLPISLIQLEINRLQKMGLINNRGAKGWELTQQKIHLSTESTMIGTHHSNWRHIAALKAQNRDTQALQYSGIHAMSHSDFKSIQKKLIRFISEMDKIISPSPEEEIFYVGFDSFKL